MSTNINANVCEETPIQNFFNGCSVFVTGATGFMGKCLIEKLLRSCPTIGNIYILVREKRGKNIQTRVEELFNDSLFDRLKEQSTKLVQKVVPIAGDVSQSGLGLSLPDRHLLEEHVSIVFHVAATVKFDEKLRVAIAINLHGTMELVNLCRGMKHLKSVVHVSTVYANCHLPDIEERFCNFPVHYDDLEQLLAKLDDHAIHQLTPSLLGPWPNTYTYTKALAEAFLQENALVSTSEEPIRGWIDNIYGPTGVYTAALMGALSSLYCDGDVLANIVPVDMTINCLIAIAHQTAQAGQIRDSGVAKIYNYISTVENPLSWGEYCAINTVFGNKYPSINALSSLTFSITTSYTLHRAKMILFHMIPAVCIDTVFLCIGKKPRLLKIYKQTEKFANILAYFCNTHRRFTNHNVQTLWTQMDSRDQAMFNFDMKKLKWLEFFRNCAIGIKKYILKEDLNNLDQAKLKNKRLFVANQTLKIIFLYVSMHTFFKMCQTFVKYIYRYLHR